MTRGTLALFLGALLFASAAPTALAGYKVEWHYDEPNCVGPANSGSFMNTTACTVDQCTSSAVNSKDATCATSRDDLVPAGKGQFYVTERWQSSPTCSGSSAGIMYSTNKCLKVLDKYHTSYCEGDMYYDLKCDDSECTVCTVEEEQQVNVCITEAGTSKMFYCAGSGAIAAATPGSTVWALVLLSVLLLAG